MDWFGPTGKVLTIGLPFEVDHLPVWYFPCTLQHGGKHLSLQLLRIVNSRFISVTRTSMSSDNRSVAASQTNVCFGC